MLDFAIAPRTCAEAIRWEVLMLRLRSGAEIAQPIASFGERAEAERFLDDFLAALVRLHRDAANVQYG